MEIGASSLYWAASGGALACFLVASIAPAAGETGLQIPRWIPRIGPRGYAGLMALVLALFRWPAITNPKNVGIDEGLWIAGTLTLGKDPVFWRAVDGDTAGPLIYYILMPLEPLGLLNYVGLKIVATLLLGGALWFSYAGFRAVWGDALGRVCLLPAAVFFACETRWEFLGYSTEQVPVLLLAIGLGGLLACIARPENFSPRSNSWVGAGLALGAVPFAKLQGVPPAGFLVVAALIWAVSQRAWSARQRGRAVATFLAAVGVVPIGFAVLVALAVKWEDFWIPYLAQSAARTDRAYDGASWANSVAWRFVLHGTLFKPLFFGAWLVAVGALLGGARWRIFGQWPVFVLAGLAGASLAAGLLPAYSFHHLLFLVLPLTLLAGGLVATRWKHPSATQASGRPAWWQRGWLAFFLVGLVVPMFALLFRQRNIPAAVSPLASRAEIGPLAREILQRARPEDRLAAWGDQRGLHAVTRLIQGARDADGRVYLRGRYRDYFRRRYLADIERNQPRFFVDHVSAQPEDSALRARLGHEAVPELRDYVQQHYDYVGEFEGMRLYLRKGARL